jgi:uncharacterized SAM-binding protein YcdF (DUF218 family)
MRESKAGKEESPGGLGLRSCLLALLVVLALLFVSLRAAGAFLITGDTLKKADVVVPLGGGGDWRVEEAVRLIEEKYAVNMVLTEPGEITPGEGPASNHFRQVAVDEGLSPNAIIVTDGVQRSTHEEAEALLALMQKHNMNAAIVVTDPFHTQRSRLIFRAVFDGSGRTVRVHPVPNHWYRSSTWFFRVDGWGNTLREYGKLAAFWLGLSGSLE